MELKAYSEKGMVLIGADLVTLEKLARECPKMAQQHVPSRNGVVMSRRWEKQVRALLEGLAGAGNANDPVRAPKALAGDPVIDSDRIPY